MPWSWVDTEYSIHWVLHTPSTPHAEYCIHQVLHHLEIHCLAAPSHSLISRQTLLYSILYNPTITSQQMNRVSARVAPSSTSAASGSTASGYTASKYPPISIDHGLQVDFQIRLISASNGISKTARSQPRSASLSSLDHGAQVHVQIDSITASEFISKFTWSRPPSVDPNSFDSGLQVPAIMAS